MKLSGRIPHGQGGEIGGRMPRPTGKVTTGFTPRSATGPAAKGNTSEPYRSKPGVTTSPSNTISKGKGQSVGPMRPQGDVPRGHVSKTTNCD
jgi:hypothetical protein